MTFQSDFLALSGVQALWPLTDAGGTTAADVGPNNLPGTYSASKVTGAELVSGAGTGMLSGTGGVTFSRASAVAIAPTAAATLCVWLQPTSLTTSAVIAGRANHLVASCNVAGSLGGTAYADTTTALLTPQNWTSTGSAYFLCLVYTGAILRVYINGTLRSEVLLSGALATNTSAFLAGHANFQGTLSHLGIVNRALTGGEIWSLFISGSKVTPVNSGLPVDLVSDAVPVIAGAALAPRCAVCHGSMRVNESSVTRASGAVSHPGCYATKGIRQAVATPTSATAWVDYEGALLHRLHTTLQVISERTTSVTQPTYWDATTNRLALASGTLLGYDNFGLLSLNGAILAHHTNAPTTHWTVQTSIATLDRMFAMQDSTGLLLDQAGNPAGMDFVGGIMGEAILCLRRHVTLAKYADWVGRLVKMTLHDRDFPVGATDLGYYVNGNREAGKLFQYYMAWRVSGRADMLAIFEQELAFWVTLETKPRSPGDASGNKTYGFQYVVPGSAPDGSDAKGYSIERTTARIGSVVSVDTGAVLNGYDPNYSILCNSFLVRIWLHSRDPRLLKPLNAQMRLVMDTTNTTSSDVVINGTTFRPFLNDGRGGSRQINTAENCGGVWPALKHVAGAPYITSAHVAGAFAEMQKYLGSDFIGQSTFDGRWLGFHAPTWLMALPTWPGLPA